MLGAGIAENREGSSMGSKRWWLALIAVFAGICMAREEAMPLYELGIGMAGLHSPHYLGSAQHHNLLTPVPYLVYRGERLRVDRSGVKTFLIDEGRLDINISLNGSLPVDSDDNRARRGMPDLDPMGEIGPTVRYTLWEGRSGQRQLRLDLPVRAAITADGFDLDYRGLSSSPGVAFYSTVYDWRWSASYAAIFSDRSYHGYFYDVDTPYVTPQRGHYRAKSGYTASRLSVSTTHYFDNWFLGAFVSYYSLHGAANENSPLVHERGQFSAGLMATWFFKKSSTLVSRQPEAEF